LPEPKEGETEFSDDGMWLLKTGSELVFKVQLQDFDALMAKYIGCQFMILLKQWGVPGAPEAKFKFKAFEEVYCERSSTYMTEGCRLDEECLLTNEKAHGRETTFTLTNMGTDLDAGDSKINLSYINIVCIPSYDADYYNSERVE